jgi:hypothetical protein
MRRLPYETDEKRSLTDREIDWLEEILLKYGMDDSVLCFSELDGLLTAILSGQIWFHPISG